MKLTQNQKVALYGSALQGLLAGGANVYQGEEASIHAVNIGDKLIKHLEAMPHEDEPITHQ